MKIVNFSSGSKGNTTYIETKNAKILIDMGNNCKYVVNCLEQININPKDIDGIIITHIHKDHVAGLNVFLKKYNIDKSFLIQSDYPNTLDYFKNIIFDDEIILKKKEIFNQVKEKEKKVII